MDSRMVNKLLLFSFFALLFVQNGYTTPPQAEA
jgi:hypothetical protein